MDCFEKAVAYLFSGALESYIQCRACSCRRRWLRSKSEEQRSLWWWYIVHRSQTRNWMYRSCRLQVRHFAADHRSHVTHKLFSKLLYVYTAEWKCWLMMNWQRLQTKLRRLKKKQNKVRYSCRLYTMAHSLL